MRPAASAAAHRAGAAQDAQSGAYCSAYHQRPDTTHGNLLLRGLRHGDDVADREGRALLILHLLDQGPAGRDGLQGAHGADG